MQLFFADLNQSVVDALKDAFEDIRDIQCHRTEIGQACSIADGHKVVINAGNSSSLQDGGVDGAISRLLSTPSQSIESLTQRMIDDSHFGQLPVGSAVMVPSPSPVVAFMIYAPTMLAPENVSQSYNAYAAFRAAMIEIIKYNKRTPDKKIETIICGGLATGAGEMDPATSAKQMRLAWNSLKTPIPHRWKEVWTHHKKLVNTFKTKHV